MKKKTMVFGSFVVDLMARTPHLPVPGETVKGSLFKQGAGGKGFNQGVAAHKAGGDVAVSTKIGRDTMANVALDAMDALGMSKEYLFFSDEASTGIALISVDENTSQNEIVIVSGACATFTDDDIASVESRIKESAYLLLQLEINQDANEKVAELAKKNGTHVIINTAPYQPVRDEFLNGAYLVTPNEVEAEALTGVRVFDLASADRAAKVFFDKGVQNVLITLGGQGAYVNTEGHSRIIPAYKVNAIDTTGAGDAFNGGLIVALAEGKTLVEAARFANAVGALSVQRIGTTPSMPTREEIDAFLAAQA
ncbi:MAG: ribokinase [Eubacteriales bacterium]|nr:ribokinase [Eubacteriales bacterium]MDD4711515.1 ribokinase [Eubacteriales bacterium]